MYGLISSNMIQSYKTEIELEAPVFSSKTEGQECVVQSRMATDI